MEKENVGSQKFKAVLDKDEKHIEFEIVPLEQWSKLRYKNVDFYEDINVNINHLVGMKMKKLKNRRIKNVWDSVCKMLGYQDYSYPNMEDNIFDLSTNVYLKDIVLPE